MTRYGRDPVCDECGEPLTPNSAVYDDWGTPDWYCTNPDCEESP